MPTLVSWDSKRSFVVRSRDTKGRTQFSEEKPHGGMGTDSPGSGGFFFLGGGPPRWLRFPLEPRRVLSKRRLVEYVTRVPNSGGDPFGR